MSAGLTEVVGSPVPATTGLSPASVPQGSPAFTLSVQGSNFVAGSFVDWNNTPLTTTFVSSTLLQAAVPASLVADSSAPPVYVITPAPGGGVSNPQTFTVVNVPPTATLAGPAQGVTSQPLTFTLGATDPSPFDRASGFIYTVNWGDGSPVQTVPGPPATAPASP
jgi:hypothetical protein